MTRNTLVLLVIIFCSSASFAKNGTPTSKAIHPHKISPCAPGVVYVKLKLGSTVFSINEGKKGPNTLSLKGSGPFQQLMQKLGFQQAVMFDPAPKKDSIDIQLGIDRLYSIYYSNHSIDPHQALTMLEATGEVECGSPRYLFPLATVPNDPLIGQQYALTTMNVFNAWNKTTGDTTIVIADVDCAINIDHVDLKKEIKYNWGEIGIDSLGEQMDTDHIDNDHDGYIDNWEGWDLCGDVADGAQFAPNPDPRPREAGASHGTHTAGCILASGNNGIGIAGVAYGCRLLAIKASGSDYQNILAGYEGIHYASTHGARITNCSWGGFTNSSDTALSNTFLYEAIERNNLVVAAAGNNSSTNDGTLEYPADGPGVLSVGADSASEHPANFTDYGHSVSVWAPGVQIVSCDYNGSSDSIWSAEDGTSFSSPLTVGAAGIIASLHHDWKASQIANLLIQTASNVVDPADRYHFWGEVNLGAAVNSLMITGYAVNGVASDSLGAPNVQQNLSVKFKNVGPSGPNYTVTALSSLGCTALSTPVSLGPIDTNGTATGTFEVTRTGVYSQGPLAMSFAVSNGSGVTDTLSIDIPLSVSPGFVPDIPGIYGSSITRVSNSVAWAAFGQATSNGFILGAQFANEAGGSWNDTLTLNDGLNPPYDVTALDSNNAFFGSGPPGGTASVIYTNDGGADFNEVDVSNFAAFVNTIHFFDSQNGILIGDPVSSRWGIGITNDGGQTWNPLTKPVVAAGSIASWNNATAWVGNNGWFGTNSRSILRTTNRGQSWTSIKTGLHQNALGIAFAPDAKHGFACFLPANGNGDTAMAVSSDSGASWQTLTTLPVRGMLPGSIQFIPNSNTAILTSDQGAYRTSDFGETWWPIGIPIWFSANQADLGISRGNGEFVASINSSVDGVATYVEAMPDSSLSVTSENSPITMLDVYPNPMQKQASILFELPESAHVHVALFNALGESIMDVLNADIGAGQHEYSLDTHTVPPGSYFLHFETSSGAEETRAITILP